jgi:Putative transmembrane protein (PGPGW)
MNQHVLRFGRQIAIAVVGGTVLVAGIVLALPLVPGPGIPLILLGLGILSLEFKLARSWMARIKGWGVELKRHFEERRSRSRDRP